MGGYVGCQPLVIVNFLLTRSRAPGGPGPRRISGRGRVGHQRERQDSSKGWGRREPRPGRTRSPCRGQVRDLRQGPRQGAITATRLFTGQSLIGGDTRFLGRAGCKDSLLRIEFDAYWRGDFGCIRRLWYSGWRCRLGRASPAETAARFPWVDHLM